MKDSLDLSRCVRCGSCKALCPTYSQETVEPMTARGRLALLWGLERKALSPTALLNERLFSCALCGICEAACPTGMEITEAIYSARSALRASDSKRRYLRAAAGFALRRPALAFGAASFLRPLMPYILRKAGVPFGLDIPDEPLRGRRRIFKGTKTSRGRVALFTGCSVNYIFPHLGKRLIEMLLTLGYEVVLPPAEVCCGAPLRALGLEDEAVELSKKNIEVFGRLHAETVLSLCPTCTLTLKRHYPALTGAGIENAMDASEFLSGRLDARSEVSRGAVVYHDPCHLRYGLGVKEQPRRLLAERGYEVVEKEPGCCGFSLSLTHEKLSAGLLEGFKADGTVVTACPGCMMQLRRRHKRVVHLIEALA